jgi:hypothetical protein
MENEQVPVRLHLTGPAFEHRGSLLKVDLLSFSRTILDVQCLLDRSYAVASGTRRLSKRDRQEFKLIANRIKPGSLDIEAMLNYSPLMVPLITGVIPTAYKVVKNSIEAFELGKKIRKMFSDSKPAGNTTTNNYYGPVTQITAKKVIITNPLTQETVEADPEIYVTAVQSSRTHERLLQNMNQDSVTGFSLSTTDNLLKMETSVKDKYLYKPQLRLDETIQKYRVKLHALDVETNSGELRLYEEEKLSVPIRFTIIGAQDLQDYSMALNMDVLTVNALPEYKSDLSGRSLVRLHIASITLTAKQTS